jgi:hypothetical protein
MAGQCPTVTFHRCVCVAISFFVEEPITLLRGDPQNEKRKACPLPFAKTEGQASVGVAVREF